MPVGRRASQLPGIAKWSAFLQGNLRYPQDAIEQEIQGQVMLSFIVHPDGTLSDIEAISGPELLRAEAVRVLRLAPKWIAAQKNGQPVLFRQRQPIRFVLEKEVSEEHSGKRP